MDRGIWGRWYDVDPAIREEYLDWLHRGYLPQMLKRPGYLWAAHIENNNSPERRAFSKKRYLYTDDPAVGTGNEFLLLFGGETAHTFLNPDPRQLMEDASPRDRAMLRAHLRERSGVFTEVDRVDGPAIDKLDTETSLGPVVQMGTYNSHSVEDEAFLCSWYVRHRMPLMQSMPECIRARRLVSVVGWAKQSILYEFANVADPDGHFSDANAESKHVITTITHAPNSPTLGHRVWPPVAA
jgi:hypothetical protein